MTRRSEASVAARTHSLNRDAVVIAALDLIDQEGVQAVTMRGIAVRLGVKAQSLYTHVDSRKDLLDAVADRIVTDIDDDLNMRRVVSDPWPHFFEGTARAVRGYAHRHPNAFVLLATRPAGPYWPPPPLLSHHWTQAILASLERSGFTDDEATFACRAFDAFLLGSLLLETRDRQAQPGTAGPNPGTNRRDAYPHQTSTMPRPVRGTDRQHDDDFTSALDNVIDRITTRTRRRTHATLGQSDVKTAHRGLGRA